MNDCEVTFEDAEEGIVYAQTRQEAKNWIDREGQQKEI
jgi:hypothetical protein